MSRIVIAVWMVLLGLSAYGLFSIKYKVHNLKRDIEEIDRQLASDRDEIHVLRAEWTYLNQPERLRQLAEKHLGLQPMTVAQIEPMEYQGITLAAGHGSPAAAEAEEKPELASAVSILLPTMKPAAPGRE